VELSLPPFPRRKPTCTTITVERVRSRQENVSRLLFNTIQILVAVAIPILVIIFIAFQIPPGTMMGLVQHPVTNNVEVVIPRQEKGEKLDFPKGFPQISTIDLDPLTYSNYNPRKYDNEEMAKIQDEVMTALFAQMPALILDAMDDFLAASTPTADSKLDMGQNDDEELDDLVHKLLQGNVGKAKPQEKPEFTHNVPTFGHPSPFSFGVHQEDPIIEPIPPVLNPAAAADNVDWPIWKYVEEDENENAPYGQTRDAIPLPAMFDGIEDSDEDPGLWSAMV